MTNMTMPPFGYGYQEEKGFKTLKEQCKEQMNNSSAQSSTITQLENRISALEDIVFKAQTEEIINNIANMASGESLEVTFPTNITADKSIEIKENTQVTLDLNNKSIKAETPNVDTFLIADGATLTINGDGVISAANGGNGYPIIANGKLVINGGSFVSGYDADNLANACVYARGNGQIEIYGGRFETTDGTFVLNIKDADRATASIKVMGGEFVNFDPSNNASEGVGTNFVAEGYEVESYTEGENTIYKVVKK
jgi:hypothetical protein